MPYPLGSIGWLQNFRIEVEFVQPYPISQIDFSNFFPVDDRMLVLVKSAVTLQANYEGLTKRQIVSTGEIGELLVCRNFDLLLAKNKLSKGYDAIRVVNNGYYAYQIKTRRLTNGRDEFFGAFAKDEGGLAPFHYALFALLDKSFCLKEVWQAPFDSIAKVLPRDNGKNGYKLNMKQVKSLFGVTRIF